MDSKLNPQIRTVEVGTRTVREIQQYPLSFADQNKLIDEVRNRVFDAIRRFSGQSNPEINVKADSEGTQGESDIDLVSIAFETLRENFDYILELTTDNNVSLDELTNLQISEIIKNAYEMNFEEPGKNLPSLFQKGIESLWKRLSHAYLSDIRSTISDTFSTSPTETED